MMSRSQTDLYELIAGLNKKGVTVIMVSHDVNSSLRYASHILHIGSRKQLFFGTVSDYENSRAGKAFIEVEGGAEDE